MSMAGSSMTANSSEDDEEEYEEVGGSRLLGFMFGNVDDAGELDVDYLDEDAKEHLDALATELEPALTAIKLPGKSSRNAGAPSEEGYNEKAEDAVDYEDIEEQYEGPEIEAATEEDNLFPRSEYMPADVLGTAVVHKSSVFDDENYDEDEDYDRDPEVKVNDTDVHSTPSTDLVSLPEHNGEYEFVNNNSELEDNKSPVAHDYDTILDKEIGLDNLQAQGLSGTNNEAEDVVNDEGAGLQEEAVVASTTPLPVLCFQNGMAILRFSEIFGVHQPLRKAEKRERGYFMHTDKYTSSDVPYIVEEDEEDFLKDPCQGFTSMSLADADDISSISDDNAEISDSGLGQASLTQSNDHKRDSCVSAEPLNQNSSLDISLDWKSDISPKFYQLDQLDWENEIIWGNSPLRSNDAAVDCDLSGPDSEISASSAKDNDAWEEKDGDVKKEGVSEGHQQIGFLGRFNELAMRNDDLEEGSWLENIIWEQEKPIPKPKLILDLQDECMLFEVSDDIDHNLLQLHARAMIIARPAKPASAISFEIQDHGGLADGRFNIANDKFYSNRKTSPQLKSILKKRTVHGVKILHCIPALKLQTMKAKLSNKELANFHRPKAVWYPHVNEVVVKQQEKLPTQGPMKIILKSLGGKGSKLHVDAEETISSVKLKAAKKLDLKPSEAVRIIYSGRELDDDKNLADQDVRPNSLLHLVRTKIHPLVIAQRYPGENKSLRPPGAFKKKSDLSVKDGHVFLMEYFEERPLLLGNVGMGARLCTYYQKLSSDDQTGDTLRNSNSGLGTVLTLDPADKSPFLGDLKPGCSQSSLETNMYRAPAFPQKVASTDYLLVRSPKGKLSIRRIDKIHVVGQQEPHMEVMSPVAKSFQMFLMNRLLVYMYREFQTAEKRGVIPYIRADELAAQFPEINEPLLRKRLKHCADLQKRSNGQWCWVMRRNFHIPSEEELRRMVTPENVCAYESMRAGLLRLKRLGITKLAQLNGPTQLSSLSSAVSQLPDEAIALCAASHIEKELQITPWNLSSNFVACTSQDKENIERLEITGVGDPSGSRGLGFSYVRLPPKAPIANTMVKKKPTVVKGSTVTGTDADLRRLSMEAAREVLLKFNVSDEQITKLTRWHRIALIRKLSSEQAASGIEVDSVAISKFARGQRMSFLQLQQQTRDKCQEIWDRQVQALSAVDGDENESDSEANSDLDSFAGDLENLLDAEECEETEEDNLEFKHEKSDAVRGLKMRRHSSQAQLEEEFEDEAAEAAELRRLLMDDDALERKKKKAKPAIKKFGPQGLVLNHGFQSAELNKKKVVVKQKSGSTNSVDPFSPKQMEVEPYAKGTPSIKVKPAKSADILSKKVKLLPNGEKKERKSARDCFVCGACGQEGHMRTNKNCPRYGKEPDLLVNATGPETPSDKANSLDPSSQSHQKPSNKKSISKILPKVAPVDAPDGEKSSTKLKSLKVKCASVENVASKIIHVAAPIAEQPTVSESDVGNKPLPKVNKLKITNKMKTEEVEPQKLSLVVRPPVDPSRDQPRQKVTIKQPKEASSLDHGGLDGSFDTGYRKTKKMVELTQPDLYMRQNVNSFSGEGSKGKARDGRRLLEEEKRRNAERLKEEKARRIYLEERRMVEEQDRLAELRRYEEAIRIEREEEEHQKAQKKNKKKKRDEIEDEYLEDYQFRRNSRAIAERDRSSKRKNVVELGRYAADHLPPTKRRRGGEVALANILEGIVEAVKARREVSYLFLKPVSKKEAPDYHDIVERPMDLSTIRDKIRKMVYKDRKQFRHDVWQIAYNAHLYNEGRNPGIPPLAQQLLDLSDFLLEQNDAALSEAETSIADL
ncbi:hypothetical protein V2J09_020286 [Rumex salicifolius]